MAETRVVGGRVSLPVYNRVKEIISARGITMNQFVREAVESYLKEYLETAEQTEPSSGNPKMKTTNEEVRCPLCDAPLVYKRGWLSDKIECSNPVCDTHRKHPLPEVMGQKAYLRLLNLRRREFVERTQRNEETGLWWW